MKQNKQKTLKQGFTLLELLVVVLIIGILAGIALAQYNKAVEKAKLTEALLNFKAIKESMDRFFLLGQECPEQEDRKDMIAEVELSGGSWNYNEYETEKFLYQIMCNELNVYRTNSSSYYVLNYRFDSDTKNCWDGGTEMGQYICHYLESQGWEYNEGDY